MNSLDKSTLQRQLTYMKNSICLEDEVVDHLVSMETFSFDQRSRILLPNSLNKENIQRMIDHLIKAEGPNAFNNLLEALKKSGNNQVAKALENTKAGIEKGSKEVSEMGGDQLSIKELTKELANIKSTVQEHQKRIHALEAESKRKEDECRQLKEKHSTSNETYQERISKLTEKIEMLKRDQSAEEYTMMEFRKFILNLSHEKKKVTPIVDFIYGNSENLLNLELLNTMPVLQSLRSSRNPLYLYCTPWTIDAALEREFVIHTPPSTEMFKMVRQKNDK